jgi:hypothetical protein
VDSEQPPTYRVIGVRDDGTRVDIDDSLSADRAKDIHRRLTSTSAFSQVLVEQENPATKKLTSAGDGAPDDSVVFDLEDTAKAKPKPKPS